MTGGLGEIGLEVAGLLARAARARLVLVGRTGLPAREDWDGWLGARGGADPVSRRILKVRALEALGAEILPIRADVADPDGMRAVCAEADARFGAIHGVVHAAGVTRGPSFGPLRELTREGCAEQFRAKVLGTQVLAGRPRGTRTGLLCPHVLALDGARRAGDGGLRGGQPLHGGLRPEPPSRG